MPTAAHRNSFYSRARGSAVEVDNFIELAQELGYVSLDTQKGIADHCARLIHLLNRIQGK